MTFVATVNAENIETLTDSYITLGKHLGITEYSLTKLETSKREKPEETIQCLRRLIPPQVRKYSTWLIVADNVVDLKSVRSFLPQTGSEEWGHGQLLITTQGSSAIPHCAPHTYHESLSKGMQKEDAVVLLEKVSQVDDREQATNVAKVLDYQPLALAAAAYYLQTVVKNGSPNYNWSKYLEGLTHSQREATENVFVSDSSVYSKTTTKAVEMALQRAVDTDEVLRHTFSFFALCACEVVPLDAVAKFVKARVTHQPEELINGKILRSCMILVSAHEEEEQRPCLGLHNIVHAVLKQNAICKQEPSDQCQNVAEAIKIFQLMLEVEDGNFALLRKLTLHCKSLLENMTSRSSSPETPLVNMLTPFLTVNEVLEWLHSFANVCNSLSCYILAKRVIDLARMSLMNISDTEKEALMGLRGRIFTLSGSVYERIGEYGQAREFYEESLMIFTRSYGDEDSRVATTYHNLGIVYRKTREYTKAKELYEKALEIQTKICGEDNALVAASYVNLGNVFYNTGEYLKAKELYEKALEIQRKIFGKDNENVATSYHNLGNVYGITEEYIKAKELYEKALEIQKKIFGEDNDNVATSYRNLGNVYFNTGEYTKAKELYENALEIQKRIYGEDNALLALSYANLGNVYRSTGEYMKAEKL